MTFVAWILVGVVVGWIARWVMPGPDPLGRGGSVCLGVGGAVASGLVSVAFFPASAIELNIQSAMLALSGALVVLICYRAYALRWED